jgi:hypothetical protein
MAMAAGPLPPDQFIGATMTDRPRPELATCKAYTIFWLVRLERGDLMERGATDATAQSKNARASKPCGSTHSDRIVYKNANAA